MAASVSDEAFARAIEQMGLATFDEVEAARAAQAESVKKGLSISLGEALVQRGIITPSTRQTIEKKVQAQQAGGIKQLGAYKLLKKLGEGGMGAVYLADDINAGRKVAVKVLPKRYADDREFLTRFRREAQATGKLNHVNIVGAYTIGEELGVHYYAMEYCEGETLDKTLNRDQVIPWDKAVGVVLQVARGLKHAHEHGIIHRDIKPANIFICKPPRREGELEEHILAAGFTAKILDLGLSKRIGGTEQSFFTQTGVALGTPHYISPEQAKGEKDLDGRTDIYSLGATFYHLVTGQTPFSGATAAIVMMKHLNEQIPNPQDILEDIPNSVVHVIQNMMAKEPGDRYRDCNELLADLELVIDGKPPSSRALEAVKSSVAMRLRPPSPLEGEGRREPSGRGAVGERGVRGAVPPRRAAGPPLAQGTRQHEPVERRGRARRGEGTAGPALMPLLSRKTQYIVYGALGLGVLILLLALLSGGGGEKETAAKPEDRGATPGAGRKGEPEQPNVRAPSSPAVAKALDQPKPEVKTPPPAAVIAPLPKDLAPNTWVKLHEFATGGRSSPMFFYEPGMRKFFLAGGVPSGGYAEAKRHFDVEVLDLEARTWTNAYPPGAPYKNVSGETDAPAIGEDHLKGLTVQDKNGVSRIAMFGAGYGSDSRAHFQWAYDPDSRRLFAYLYNQTVCYDPLQRVWKETGAAPFSKGSWAMVWGNLCYDPLNKEILSIGGSSDEDGGTPGTWVYKISENAWKKVEPGSKERGELHAKAAALRRPAWALTSACRSRFFVTETEAEAKAKLSERAAALTASVKKLAGELDAARLAGSEAEAVKRGAARLGQALAKLKAAATELDGAMSAEVIAEVKSVYDELEAAALALAPEPPARAHAQPAFDARNGKIVLFGGSGLDRCYADTWLYDPKTRSWEQKYPRLSPSPRAGHALLYLPRSGKVVLAGGYTIDGWFKELPHQVWVYDTAANEWKLLLSLPAGPEGHNSAGAPRGQGTGGPGGGGSPWAGAASPEDLLIMVDTYSLGRITWACKVDPSKADSAGTENLGVPPGTMSFSSQPAEWEKAARPEPATAAEFFKNLTPNTWTAIGSPKEVPCRASANTTAYDPERQQFLWWGGGIQTYMGTDVDHYSVRSNHWTLGYAPDLPTEPTGGYYVKAALSFQDRPQVPIEAHRSYAYDPPSERMLFLDRAYDVAERQWDPNPYPGLEHRGCINTRLATTPNGVVAFSELGLFRFEWTQKCWRKLPWNGPSLGGPQYDHPLCYDSKRDCLWFAKDRILVRYDLKSGYVEKLDLKPPLRLDKLVSCFEWVFIPDADLLLLMQRFKTPDGQESNVVFDPNAKKYYAVRLPFSDGKPHKFGGSCALHYDAKLGIALLHDVNGKFIWALKFDRKTAKLTEIAD